MLKHLADLPGEAYALLSSLVSLGIVFYRKRKAARKKLKFIAAIEDLSDTLECMLNILRDTSADRVLLLSGHNCGGIPRNTSPFYVSVMHYCYREVNKSRRANDYKKLCVDAAYVEMLITTYIRGHYHFDPDKEPEGQLKYYYGLEGVTDSHIFSLGVQENKMFFVSVAKCGGKFNEQEHTLIKLKSQKLANLIKD